MAITASLVNELRQKTGVGLMHCKKALEEANGDIEVAITKLREAGMAKAAKKSDRETKEGRVFIQANDKEAVIVEMNCETDFVASNDDFVTLGNKIAQTVLNDSKIQSIETLENTTVDGLSFKDFLAGYVFKIGENLTVKQFTRITAESIGTYIHMNGKIGVAVAFSGSVADEAAKDIAMHIAAANPQYIKPEEVPTEELSKESEIIKTQALNEGKPAEVVDKIVQGRINKFYKEVCLLEQAFIKDDKKAIKNLLPQNTGISTFVRYAL